MRDTKVKWQYKQTTLEQAANNWDSSTIVRSASLQESSNLWHTQWKCSEFDHDKVPFSVLHGHSPSWLTAGRDHTMFNERANNWNLDQKQKQTNETTWKGNRKISYHASPSRRVESKLKKFAQHRKCKVLSPLPRLVHLHETEKGMNFIIRTKPPRIGVRWSTSFIPRFTEVENDAEFY